MREWSTIAAEARRVGNTIHLGRLFCICTEKGSELPKGDPNRKFKGRVVFHGNNIRDQNYDWAVFQGLSSVLLPLSHLRLPFAMVELKATTSCKQMRSRPTYRPSFAEQRHG